jgi:N-acetylglucosaminyldiphosphoundecaprenol N-acetyl-beta-D-mannosaminyltransferase
MNNPAQEPAADLAVHLLGVTVHRLTLDRLKTIIAEAVQREQRWIIAHHNLHSVYVCHHNAKVRSFYTRAKYVYIDGMSLVLLGRLLRLPLSRRHRLTSLDWIYPITAEAARQGWRIFYLGSGPGVAERGAQILRGKFPGLQIETANGYFDARPGSVDNRRVVDAINRLRPNILMVGMGLPRQEKWILDNLENIRANTIFNLGAMMDYIAGALPAPPRWLGQVGFEWLFRLLSQPGYLWKRYLIEPWFILGLFMSERIGRQRMSSKRRT